MAHSYASWDSFTGVMTVMAWAADPDLSGLCEILRDVIFEDNRRGVMAGLDKDGRPMTPTIRERTPQGHWVTRVLPDGRKTHYYQAGSSPSPDAPAGVSEGSGPPLAPRGERSRVITNLETGWGKPGPGLWVVYGGWEGLTSGGDAEVDFLTFHFEGQGRLPTRDLAGLRPQGLEEAMTVVSAWVENQINARFQEVS